MPGSQLKRLKASLREQGVIGPQQSKKQKKRNAQDVKGQNVRRLQKVAALGGIREQFNPFDLKHNPRGPKFEVTSNQPVTANAAKGINGKPGVAKALGEERRRDTLLVEMQRRNKVGGILDRRFGEDDPTMAPEDKMLERFAREKQRSHKKSSMFDLEDDEPTEGLTHFGKALSFDRPKVVDDFDEDMEPGSDDDLSEDDARGLKRLRPAEEADGEDAALADGAPERKKTKQEVMKEVIAKSKFHKYERQAAKDADEDLREELDNELPNLHALLYSRSREVPKPNADVNTAGQDQAAIHAAEKAKREKEYDLRLRQMIQDRRAQPTERTKTEEEVAEEGSKRLKELEEKRLKRMRGEEVSDDEDESGSESAKEDVSPAPAFQFLEAEEEDFGLGKGIKTKPTATELGFDDEDDFIIEDDLLASGSDLEPIESEDSDSEGNEESDSDDEFTKGLLNEEESNNPVFSSKIQGTEKGVDVMDDADGLPFTFPCPQSHEELLEATEKVPLEKLSVVVQRVRALYHPKLDSSNKAKLSNFSKALIKHLSYLSNTAPAPSFAVLESLIRHIHSLAKTFPVDIANEFRAHIEDLTRTRPLAPNPGDLIILSAIGTIFPTSDHFHQVVTPAMLLTARYLGQKVPQTLSDYSKGLYLSVMSLQYQQIAKRYVPELMNFCLNTLCSLAPAKPRKAVVSFTYHEPVPGIRINGAKAVKVRKLTYTDWLDDDSAGISKKSTSSAQVAIMSTAVLALDTASELWAGKIAYSESFTPVLNALQFLCSKNCRSEFPESLIQLIEKTRAKIERMLKVAHVARRPVELHHHKPLAIKTAIPKFEDTFDPKKHYDPDRERAELSKLKAEHKREKKGALRELRKDANFMAREKLRLKKEKDAAYEKKYKRLVAEIQGEEGREANEYAREKDARKRANKKARG